MIWFRFRSNHKLEVVMVKIGGENITSLIEIERMVTLGRGAEVVKGKSVKVHFGENLLKRDQIIKAAIKLALKEETGSLEDRKQALDNILTKLNGLTVQFGDENVQKVVEKHQAWGRKLYKRDTEVEKAKATLDKMKTKLVADLQKAVEKEALKYFKNCNTKHIELTNESLLTFKGSLERKYSERFEGMIPFQYTTAIKDGASEAWEKVYNRKLVKARRFPNPIWPEAPLPEAPRPIERTASQLERDVAAERERLQAQQEQQVREWQEEAARRKTEREAQEAARKAEVLPCGKTVGVVEEIEKAFNELKVVAKEMGAESAQQFAFNVSSYQKADETLKMMQNWRGFYRNMVSEEGNRATKKELNTKYQLLVAQINVMRTLVDEFPR